MTIPTASNTLIERYLAAWNETDADARLELVRTSFTPAATYADPVMQGEGHQGISDMIGAFHAQFAGHTFARIPLDDEGAFAWALADPDGAVVIRGRDAYTLGENDTFAAISGTFLDQPARVSEAAGN